MSRWLNGWIVELFLLKVNYSAVVGVFTNNIQLYVMVVGENTNNGGKPIRFHPKKMIYKATKQQNNSTIKPFSNPTI